MSVTLEILEKTVTLMIRDDGLTRTLRDLSPTGGQDIEERFQIESDHEIVTLRDKDGKQLSIEELAIAPLTK